MTFFQAVTCNPILVKETFDILKNKIKSFDSKEDELLRAIYEPHEYLELRVSEEDCVNIFKNYSTARFTAVTKWIIENFGPLEFARFHNLIKQKSETRHMIENTLDVFKNFNVILNNKKLLSEIDNFKMIEAYEKELNNFNLSIFDLVSKGDEKERLKHIYQDVKEELGV